MLYLCSVTLFQLTVASIISEDLKMNVLSLCVDELSFFAETYKRKAKQIEYYVYYGC